MHGFIFYVQGTIHYGSLNMSYFFLLYCVFDTYISLLLLYRTPEILSTLNEISKNCGSVDGNGLRVQVHTMPNVGHWLHTENWPGVMEIALRESSCFS